MIGVVVAAHGKLAEALVEAATLVVPNAADGVQAVGITSSDDAQTYADRLRSAIDGVRADQGVRSTCHHHRQRSVGWRRRSQGEDGVRQRTVRISNDLGIHLRAAGILVQLAGRYRAEVWLERNGTRANGKSIMSVLSLAASKGVELVVSAEGDDADDALIAICGLIERGFDSV